ncbi:hypothetical protein BDW60DRAFT_176800 [Aspergillus nidulans var. acristatus]
MDLEGISLSFGEIEDLSSNTGNVEEIDKQPSALVHLTDAKPNPLARYISSIQMISRSTNVLISTAILILYLSVGDFMRQRI